MIYQILKKGIQNVRSCMGLGSLWHRIWNGDRAIDREKYRYSFGCSMVISIWISYVLQKTIKNASIASILIISVANDVCINKKPSQMRGLFICQNIKSISEPSVHHSFHSFPPSFYRNHIMNSDTISKLG